MEGENQQSEKNGGVLMDTSKMGYVTHESIASPYREFRFFVPSHVSNEFKASEEWKNCQNLFEKLQKE